LKSKFNFFVVERARKKPRSEASAAGETAQGEGGAGETAIEDAEPSDGNTKVFFAFFNLGFPPSPSSSLSAFSPSLVDSTQKCHIQLKFYVLEENEPLARCSLLIFISSSRAPKASLLAQSSALLFYAFTPEGRRERRETKEPKAESNQIRVDKHFHVHWKNYN
jgi:hypothetical protein